MSFFNHRSIASFLIAIGVILSPASAAETRAVESWFWAKMKQGLPADLSERCNTKTSLNALATDDESEKSWSDACRKLPASIIVDAFTKASLRDRLHFAGIHIIGARIVGDINLANARLDHELWIEQSRVENSVTLDGVESATPISIDGSLVRGVLSAFQLHGKRSFSLQGSRLLKDALLDNVEVASFIALDNATFLGALNLDQIKSGGDLSMKGVAAAQGVKLYRAAIDGDLNAGGAIFGNSFNAAAMRLKGNFFAGKTSTGSGARFKGLDLSAAAVDAFINLGGVTVEGDVIARFAHVRGSINANESTLDGANFSSASIDGEFAIERADIRGAFDATAMQLGGSLMAGHTRFGRTVDLSLARIGGSVNLRAASCSGQLTANLWKISGDLLMLESPAFKSVQTNNLGVAGEIRLNGAQIENWEAGLLRAGGDVLIQNVVVTGGVNWFQADIAKQLAIDSSRFDGSVMAAGIKTGDYLAFRNSSFKGPTTLAFASVGRHLLIGNSTFSSLDLSRSVVTTDLKLLPVNQFADLDLRYAHIGMLPAPPASWPDSGALHLAGITIDRIDAESRGDSSGTAKAWDDWARRDSAYAPRTYQQLASVFTATGERGLADDIRYRGRVREHETQSGLDWIWSAFQRWVAGFGIGTYPFRVILWIIGISVAGAFYLRAASKGVIDAGHSWLWCWGASLSRLLPIIDINKEFKDFFDDPKRQKLTSRQIFVFSVIGVLGWLLAAILATAVASVTGKS